MSYNSLFFATHNSYKFQEFHRLFKVMGVNLKHYPISISEVQTFDFEPIIRDKIVKAYAEIRQPVLVDHSGLAMDALNGLPQGLNNQFWHRLQNKVCDIAHNLHNDKAEIIVYLGFCDGRKIHTVFQKDPGKMATTPAAGDFHLDRVFIPDGSVVTLAEMTETERDKVSYRRKAAEKMVAVFTATGFAKSLGIS